MFVWQVRNKKKKHKTDTERTQIIQLLGGGAKGRQQLKQIEKLQNRRKRSLLTAVLNESQVTAHDQSIHQDLVEDHDMCIDHEVQEYHEIDLDHDGALASIHNLLSDVRVSDAERWMTNNPCGSTGAHNDGARCGQCRGEAEQSRTPGLEDASGHSP